MARILIVEDNPANLKLAVAILTHAGHETLAAANGEEGVATARRELPDLILLDIMMPDIDGFEVARRLKADPATRAIPIVMVTALEDRESRMHALRTLSACNVALVHARTEEELFQSVCRHIVETGGYLLAWVEYPAEECEPPRYGAHFGDEAAWRCHAELATMPEHADRCLAAIALRTRETQMCNNLLELPERCFGALREAGVEAILALPMLHDGDIYGVLTVFSSSPDAFGAAEDRGGHEGTGTRARHPVRSRCDRCLSAAVR